jgi:hypothetical protein
MKHQIKKKNPKFIQGTFSPSNPNKYKGTLPIIYRSSLELKAFRDMDLNPNIISWGSESVVIPYPYPFNNSIRRYFIDIVAALKNPTSGEIKKLLIEIKPFKQTLPPTPSKNKSQKTILYENQQFVVNQCKWKAAKEWAAKKGYIFLILTEKNYFGVNKV